METILLLIPLLAHAGGSVWSPPFKPMPAPVLAGIQGFLALPQGQALAERLPGLGSFARLDPGSDFDRRAAGALGEELPPWPEAAPSAHAEALRDPASYAPALETYGRVLSAAYLRAAKSAKESVDARARALLRDFSAGLLTAEEAEQAARELAGLRLYGEAVAPAIDEAFLIAGRLRSSETLAFGEAVSRSLGRASAGPESLEELRKPDDRLGDGLALRQEPRVEAPEREAFAILARASGLDEPSRSALAAIERAALASSFEGKNDLLVRLGLLMFRPAPGIPGRLAAAVVETGSRIAASERHLASRLRDIKDAARLAGDNEKFAEEGRRMRRWMAGRLAMLFPAALAWHLLDYPVPPADLPLPLTVGFFSTAPGLLRFGAYSLTDNLIFALVLAAMLALPLLLPVKAGLLLGCTAAGVYALAAMIFSFYHLWRR